MFLARAEPWLAKLDKPPQLKKLRDEAETIAAHLRRVGASLPNVNRIGRFKIETECRLGEILSTLPKNKGGRPGKENRSYDRNSTLAERGIPNARLSSRWQKMATVEPERRRNYYAEEEKRGGVVTSTAVYKMGSDYAREEKKRAARSRNGDETGSSVIATIEEVAGKYQCVYMDPPWAYRDSKIHGGVDHEYETLDIDGIARLPIASLLPKNGGHVWMWTTWPMIREGAVQKLFTAWGLSWKGEIVWDKDKLLLGRWIRVQTEILILGVTGSVPRLVEDVRGIHREKSGKHSAKPDSFYGMLERFSPGPRIELFARKPREGWDRWGKEA
jgi:N6-adenosine-specific RNA methylase IME4